MYGISAFVAKADALINELDQSSDKAGDFFDKVGEFFDKVGAFMGDLWDLIVKLSPSMLVTLKVFFLTLALSLPLGLLVAICRMSKFKPLSWLTRIYISIMRGTPLMLQLFVVCYGPYYMFDVRLTREWPFTAAIIAFAVNYAAYFAEIYRGGIEATPLGQYEAAQVLGYNKRQTFIRIVLPQVIKRIIPATTNEVITLVKDTSLVYALSIVEMFTKAKMIASANTSMLPYLAAGIFYYVFNYLVAFLMERAEKKLNYYQVK